MMLYRTILTVVIVAFASCEAAAGLIRPEPTGDRVERKREAATLASELK